MATKNLNVAKDTRLLSPDLGAGACDHLPVGLYSGSTYRSLLQFALDWSGVVAITSAVLWVKTSDHYHVTPDAVTVYVERNTATWTENTATHPATTAATAYPGPTTAGATGRASFASGTAANTWKSVAITTIVDSWAPATVTKSTGGPGDATANYGVRLASSTEGTDISTEFWSRETANDAYIVLTYSTNTAPNAPTLVKVDALSSGSIVNASNTSYALTFTGSDPDAGDTISSYDVQVDNTSGNSVEPDWTTLVLDANYTDGITGQSVVKTLTLTLTRGNWYALRVRTKDAALAVGAWSTTYWFKANRLPSLTAAASDPLASDLAYVHNLASDLALWTAAGTQAKPRLKFTYTDPDAQAMSRRIFRIYTAATGGAAAYTSDVSTVVASGTVVTLDTTYTMLNGDQASSERWWTVEVFDSMGESSGEMNPATAATGSRAAFKVLWAQGLYEHSPGAGSSAWSWANGSVAASTQAGFLFRSATSAGGDAATGKSAFSTSIGAVAVQAWMQALVRLATQTSTTQPNLPDMTFSYLGAAAQPDRYTFVPTAEWSLDSDVRLYGSQSVRCAVQSGTTGNRYIYPYRLAIGDDVPVVGGRQYVLSAWVKTAAPLTGGSLALRVYVAGSLGEQLDYDDVTYQTTTDTAAYADGWQRLRLTFTVPGGSTLIRPMVHYLRSSGVTETFWVDAVQVEEGIVASTWRPGLVGQAVTLDLQGIQVDATAGGIMRLRGSTGGARDVVEVGATGLVFGGDANLYSAFANELKTDDSVAIGGSLLVGGGSTLTGNTTVGAAGILFDGSVAAEMALTDGGAAVMLKVKSLLISTAYADPNPASAGIQLGADVALGRTAANVLTLAAGDRFDNNAVGRGVIKTTDQALAGAGITKVVAFDTTPFAGLGTTWNAYAGSEIRADVAGVYLILGEVSLSALATETRTIIGFGYANAATPTAVNAWDEHTYKQPASTQDVHMIHTQLRVLAVNDTVALFADAGEAATVLDARLSVVRIGLA